MSVLETTDTASARPVLVRRDGPAARITLNRPAQRNALSLELMREATAALMELGVDAEVRAIVIEGAGPAFCAGHDLGEMVGRGAGFRPRPRPRRDGGARPRLLPARLRCLHRDDGRGAPRAPAGHRARA